MPELPEVEVIREDGEDIISYGGVTIAVVSVWSKRIWLHEEARDAGGYELELELYREYHDRVRESRMREAEGAGPCEQCRL